MEQDWLDSNEVLVLESYPIIYSWLIFALILF